MRDAALAEDVTQDTIIKACQALSTFRGESSLRSWVLRIAHNTAVSTLRKRRDVLRDPNLMPETATRIVVEDRVEGSVALEAFEEALSELDELSRSIVVLREIEQLSYDEIAATLEVSLPTVKTRLLRSRRILAASLGERRP
ncbi:MAG: RNA polymerase sigma-70 factor (ECF subfamily) [Candidatus Poriferisodalaceae bacterium]